MGGVARVDQAVNATDCRRSLWQWWLRWLPSEITMIGPIVWSPAIGYFFLDRINTRYLVPGTVYKRAINNTRYLVPGIQEG